MGLIKKASQRLAERASRPVSIVVIGPSGIGKTTLAQSLNPADSLFIDLEGGTLALEDWGGDTIDVRKASVLFGIHPWVMSRYLCLLFGGPDPAAIPGDPYHSSEYEQFKATFLEWALSEDPDFKLEKYKTVFIDSITVASRHSLGWAKIQPSSFSEKTGNPDGRAAYGTHGQELVRWITHWQHAECTCILVGILDEDKDEFGRKEWSVQIEGSKAGRELPGIFDIVLSYNEIEDAEDLGPDRGGKRRLVTNKVNKWKYPAKDRSRTLEPLEEGNLEKVLAKVRAGKRLTDG